MIDSQMPLIVAESLLIYYSGTVKNTIVNVLDFLANKNPLEIKNEKAQLFYNYKFKTFLCAVALGMTPSVLWSGIDDATGGYIIVKQDGGIVTYHIYNRDKFKDYLLSNTRFESASRSRHDFGYIYENNNKLYIRLNLQIRFI